MEDDKMLGEGRYGKIVAISKTIAMKVVPSVFNEITTNNEIPFNFILETSVLKKTSHPNIIPIRDVLINHITGDCSYTMPRGIGNLKDNLLVINPRAISLGVARGIQYLIDTNIFHGDLKLDNIVLFEDDEYGLKPVIIDFGVAQINICERDLYDDSHIVWYKAPEQLLNGPYNYKAQSWALGMLMLDIHGYSLFHGESALDQLLKIFRHFGKPDVNSPWIRRLRAWKSMESIPNWGPSIKSLTDNSELNEVLKSLLILNPEERITITDALKYPFFSSETPSTSCEDRLRNNTLIIEPCQYLREEFLLILDETVVGDFQIFLTVCQIYDRFYAIRRDIEIKLFVGLATQLAIGLYEKDESYAYKLLRDVDSSTIMKLEGEILEALNHNLWFTTAYDWIVLLAKDRVNETSDILFDHIMSMEDFSSNDPEVIVRNIL